MICRNCTNGCWQRNAMLVRFLGLCPVLAVSSTLLRGLAAALVLSAAILATTLIANLVRHWLVAPLRPLFHALSATIIVSIMYFCLRGWAPALMQQFEWYLPLMALNCLVLSQAEQVAVRMPLRHAITDSAGVVLGVILAVAILAGIREFGSTGQLLTDWQLLLPAGSQTAFTGIGKSVVLFSILSKPAGALLVLGLLAALFNLRGNSVSTSDADQVAEDDHPVAEH